MIRGRAGRRNETACMSEPVHGERVQARLAFRVLSELVTYVLPLLTLSSKLVRDYF